MFNRHAFDERSRLLVLITGGTGFVGAHAIRSALRSGFRVRATIRNPAFGVELQSRLGLSESERSRLEVVKVDFGSSQEQWDRAFAGVHFCFHIAAPVILTSRGASDDVLLGPTMKGGELVVRACANNKATFQLLILCSSYTTAIMGHPPDGQGRVKTHFSSKDWSNTVAGECPSAYVRAKTLAEQLSWELAKKLGVPMTVVLPSCIFGPSILPRSNPTAESISPLIERSIPGFPSLLWNIVDVRDVADMHVACACAFEEEKKRRWSPTEGPSVVGQRLFADSGEILTYREVRDLSQLALPAWKLIQWQLPYWVFWLASFFDERVALILPQLKHRYTLDDLPRASRILQKFKLQRLEDEEQKNRSGEERRTSGFLVSFGGTKDDVADFLPKQDAVDVDDERLARRLAEEREKEQLPKSRLLSSEEKKWSSISLTKRGRGCVWRSPSYAVMHSAFSLEYHNLVDRRCMTRVGALLLGLQRLVGMVTSCGGCR